MVLSKRLKFITQHIKECSSIVDVGTDHGYIPIYAIKKGLCKSAIATDINKEPVKKAKLNICIEGLSDSIEVRLGGGFNPIVKNEVEVCIIAGMGGNLIKNILEADIKITEGFKYLILQPAQNPEVLREYLYKNKYEIICEDLCFDDGVYYELFKVKKSKVIEYENIDNIYYEISKKLVKSKNPLMYNYLKSKYNKYENILKAINDNSENANKRKDEIKEKLNYINKFMEEIKDEG